MQNKRLRSKGTYLHEVLLCSTKKKNLRTRSTHGNEFVFLKEQYRHTNILASSRYFSSFASTERNLLLEAIGAERNTFKNKFKNERWKIQKHLLSTNKRATHFYSHFFFFSSFFHTPPRPQSENDTHNQRSFSPSLPPRSTLFKKKKSFVENKLRQYRILKSVAEKNTVKQKTLIFAMDVEKTVEGCS